MTTDTARAHVRGGAAAVVAMVLTALTSFFLLFAGLATQTRYTANGVRTEHQVSLWDTRGVSALLVLSIPVFIAVGALMATRASSHPTGAWVTVALLWLWVGAFLTTIGWLYIPAAITATCAAVSASRRRPRIGAARTRLRSSDIH